MATSEDYKQMANRCAQLAIACSAPSVAQTLLALGLGIWRWLLDSVSRQKCSKIPPASEISWPAGRYLIRNIPPQTGRVRA
jgi:hypothetical protein